MGPNLIQIPQATRREISQYNIVGIMSSRGVVIITVTFHKSIHRSAKAKISRDPDMDLQSPNKNTSPYIAKAMS